MSAAKDGQRRHEEAAADAATKVLTRLNCWSRSPPKNPSSVVQAFAR